MIGRREGVFEQQVEVEGAGELEVRGEGEPLQESRRRRKKRVYDDCAKVHGQ